MEHRIEEDFLKNVKDNKTVSEEQARAAGQVLASRRYLVTERRYRAGIPWRDSRRPGTNFWEALRLFKSYLRRNGLHSHVVDNMMETISEWVRRGYARVLPPLEARRPHGFVIPSFVVTRVDKTTTQHRLVINAAKEFAGLSLNDYIAKTPDAMNGLYDVLVRFRQRPLHLHGRYPTHVPPGRDRARGPAIPTGALPTSPARTHTRRGVRTTYVWIEFVTLRRHGDH